MSEQTATVEQIRAAQNGDTDAMWRIVSDHDTRLRGIVRSVARTASADDVDDLLQEARAVLVERIRDYDTTAEAALSSFVFASIRRAVAEEWVKKTTGLTIDAGTALRVKRALVEFDGNAEAAALALKARYKLDRGTFSTMYDALQDADRLDAPVAGRDGDDESTTLADIIADPSVTITDPVERRDLARHLLSVVASRQSYALRSFYGIGMEKAADGDVAVHLQTTTGSVRQLRAAGVKSARSYAARVGIVA